ncbi:MAG: 16S rRNA (uracil(1498)-N(3))-methyltransferase [Rikenellaceae bacterium]
MQLFYAPEFTTPQYTLSEEESKHSIRVLRLSEGDNIHITDGRGNLYKCRIDDPHPKRCCVSVVEHVAEHNKLPYHLVMAVAPTKNSDRYEWFLEKATEIGVGEIIPLLSAHSERKNLKHDREERVITAAMKQSLKAYYPILHPLTPLTEVIGREFDGDKFIAHCNSSEQKVALPQLLRANTPTIILIGPEGDFSPEEVELALNNGFQEISLGKQRLRTETAAVVATTMVAIKNIE